MSLMLAQELARVGVKAEQIKTESILTLQEKKGHWDVSGIELHLTATAPHMDEDIFQHVTRTAKGKCPISRALKVPIKLVAKLETVEHTITAA
jgi:organic hydroperoxide reductase OsmC/OhrA